MKNLKDILVESFIIKKHQNKESYNIGHLTPSKDQVKNKIISIMYNYINTEKIDNVDDIISKQLRDDDYLVYQMSITNSKNLFKNKFGCVAMPINTGRANPVWFAYNNNSNDKDNKNVILWGVKYQQWKIFRGTTKSTRIQDTSKQELIFLNDEFKNFKI